MAPSWSPCTSRSCERSRQPDRTTHRIRSRRTRLKTSRISRPRIAAGSALAMLALAVPALCAAHVGTDQSAHHDAMSSLIAGFVHPFTGIDHWAAMVALGLWSAMTARRAALAPLIFATLMVVGAMLGFMNAPIAVAEPMIACSLLVLGLLVAMRWRMPSWAAA